jgi:hypothetical protein
MAETQARGEAVFDAFIENYQVKYEEAAEYLRLANGAPESMRASERMVDLYYQ